MESTTEQESKLATASLKLLDRLRELRAALITAAVTGQIDVVSWGKQGETDRPLSGSAVREADAAASSAALEKKKSQSSEPAAAGLPDTSDHSDDDVSGDDLRTDEVVARIWIAPFVDANGVYREAAHVRAVLEPAGWRVE